MPKTLTSLPTWNELASALGVTARHVRNWRMEPAAPKTPDLKAWREYVENLQGSRLSASELRDALTRAQTREREAVAELRELELEKARAGLVPLSEAQDAIRSVLGPLRVLLDAGPKSVAPRANPTDPYLAEEAMRDWLRQVYAQMEKGEPA